MISLLLPRFIDFLSLWITEDQEESNLAMDELIIQMFTSQHLHFSLTTAFVFPRVCNCALHSSLGDRAKYMQVMELLKQNKKL